MKTYDVDVQGVDFEYDGEPVLRGVTLRVPPGEFLALLGPNGGGKSTLLRLLLGLLRPSRGTVRVLGLPPAQAAPQVGYVPQETGVERIFPISALEVATAGRLRRPGGPRRFGPEDRAAAREALERLGVGDCASARMHELSGGQRQRVLIARALVGNPRILMLDEPTASVDQKTQGLLYDLLRQFCREGGTVVMASHDLVALTSHATSVACVQGTLYHHPRNEVTQGMLETLYGSCPVELIAHGVPHRVLHRHDAEGDHR